MEKKNHHDNIILCCVITIAACIIFISMYGISILNPLYTDWLMTGSDGTQHYIGAEAYRNSRWFFPIGKMNTLTFPNLASVIFTDSIPVLALIYKLLSPVLPKTFQYMGMWGLLCYILQGNLAAKLIRKYTDGILVPAMGAILFILSPVMTMRFYGHESLGGHWLILLSAMLIVYYEERYAHTAPAVRLAVAVGLLAPMVHMYFLAVCGIVIVSYGLYDLLCTRKPFRAIAVIACYALSAVGCILLLGGFGQGDMLTIGFGIYSFNLNSFFNSIGNSRLIPALPHGGGQYEGFAYLGIAQIVLLIAAIIEVCLPKEKRNGKLMITGIVMMLICIIAACSNVVMLGDRTLVTIPIPQWLHDKWAIFRATGRLIWPAYYMLMLFAVVGSSRLFKRRYTQTALLAVCIAFQVFELSPMYTTKNQSGIEYRSPLSEKKWEELVEKTNAEHIVLLGGDQPDKSLEHIEFELAYFAVRNDLTMNRFWMVHGMYEDSVTALADEVISSGSPGYLFVFTDESLCIGYPELTYYLLDNYIIGVQSSDLSLDLPKTDDFKIRFDSRYLAEGEDVEGIRYLYEDGVSYGPYVSLEAGNYKVIIDGEGLESCYCDLNSNEAANIPENGILAYERESANDRRVVFSLTLTERVHDLEIRIYNLSTDTVVLKELQIQPIEG